MRDFSVVGRPLPKVTNNTISTNLWYIGELILASQGLDAPEIQTRAVPLANFNPWEGR